MKKPSFRTTKTACYAGYIVQAAVNNLTPLLYVTFNRDFNISLSKIGLLITINFTVQIITDLTSALTVDKIGYRASTLTAHALVTVGFIMLGTLPYLMPSAYAGLVISTVFLAVGGGLIEVVVSPMNEAMPSKNKTASMSLLHSFYCWGQMLTIIISTLFFSIIGLANWRFVAFFWAILPFVNFILFSVSPIASLPKADEEHKESRGLLSGAFFCLILMMLSSGATELGIAQWASLFFESVLNVDKSVGDLLGPCAFAFLMGSGRIITVTLFRNVKLEHLLIASGSLGIVSYLLISLSKGTVLPFIGCALAGVSVAAMWPSTYSLCMKYCPKGGTAMFALAALAGDVGCTLGPLTVSTVSDISEKGHLSNVLTFIEGTAQQRGLRIGILCAIIYPLIMILSTLILKTKYEKVNCQVKCNTFLNSSSHNS